MAIGGVDMPDLGVHVGFDIFNSYYDKLSLCSSTHTVLDGMPPVPCEESLCSSFERVVMRRYDARAGLYVVLLVVLGVIDAAFAR